MCGICGILNLGERQVDREILADMLHAVRHRGPDESGLWVGQRVGFGHARLSIIDLSGGQQPMHNADRSVWITFNGEIFNYIELREEMIRKGRGFSTNSDTEVLLQLYEEEGEDCLQKLNGQWAFAIWDGRRKKLFMARDRMGVRPLYYFKSDHLFLFGSEIKALFAHPSVPRELDAVGLQEIFTFWHTIPPRTEFAGISELPPGHLITLQDGQVEMRRWWQLKLSHPSSSGSSPGKTEEELTEALGELLVDATRLRLRADVPVGAYLSGGLDSSLITAMIRRFTSAPLETFSAVFEDAEYDESSYQQQVSAHLETTHHSVRCTYEEIGRAFEDVVWHTEKTILRTAPVPMFLLSRLVRECGFKVVLTGEGADELLGGYDIFKETKIRSFWAAQPASKMRPLLLRRLYPYMPQMQSQSPEYLKTFFRVRSEDLSSQFYSHLPRWEMTRKLELLFSASVTDQLRQHEPWEELEWGFPPQFADWDAFQRAQYLESGYLLPGYILSSQGDRPAMAHAVEGRFPFLDPRVVEFASALPSNLKMHGLDEKYLLKRFAAQMLPANVVRRSKQPYRAPEVKSFLNEKTGAFRHEYVAELLSPEVIRQFGVFHGGAVQTLVERLKRQPSAATVRDSMAMTGIVSTQLLIQQFIHNSISRGSHGRDSAETACVYYG